MELAYRGVKLPYSNNIKNELNKASNRLFQKISETNISELPISEEMKSYYSGKLMALKNNLTKYSYHLGLALSSNDKYYKDWTIIDYGGGTGLLGLLAKELGVKTVIYNDINETFTSDARTFANKLNLESDYYVPGNFGVLLNFINENSIICDTIISYDVIEHIYDIRSFFKDLNFINDKSLTIVMSTGANKFNPFKLKTIIPIQKSVENGDKNGLYFGRKPYLKRREEIIKDYMPGLAPIDLKKLSKCTRGMIKEDILKVSDYFVTNHQIPVSPEHPTNTCDPITGMGTENLIKPNELKTILIEKKFKVKVLTGYYGYPSNKLKRYISTTLNTFLSVVGKRGLFIAPYWTIYAVKV